MDGNSSWIPHSQQLKHNCPASTELLNVPHTQLFLPSEYLRLPCLPLKCLSHFTQPLLHVRLPWKQNLDRTWVWVVCLVSDLRKQRWGSRGCKPVKKRKSGQRVLPSCVECASELSLWPQKAQAFTRWFSCLYSWGWSLVAWTPPCLWDVPVLAQSPEAGKRETQVCLRWTSASMHWTVPHSFIETWGGAKKCDTPHLLPLLITALKAIPVSPGWCSPHCIPCPTRISSSAFNVRVV